jgi:hypothetical protein
MRIPAFLTTIVLSFTMLTACASGTEPNDTSLSGKDDGKYPIDINQNANWHDLSEDRIDLGDDQSKLRGVVESTPGVRPGMVFLIGADAWVNAKFTEDVSASEKEQIELELKKALIKAVPRYEIHLNLK